MMSSQKRRSVKGLVITSLTLVFALLAAGCAHFVYDETPTARPAAAPSPTLTATVANASPTPTPLPTTPIVQGPTLLRLEPSVVNLAVGEKCLVHVWLDNAKRLHNVELHIGFEPRYVHIEDADPDVEGVQIGQGEFPASAQVVRNERINSIRRTTRPVSSSTKHRRRRTRRAGVE